MKAFLNTIKLRVPAHERYRAHQQIDTLVQERLSVRFPYSWKIQPFPGIDHYSLVQIVSASKLDLPGEKALNYDFSDGDLVSFECQFNSEFRERTQPNQVNRTARIGTEDEVLGLLKSAGLKNGFEVIAAEQIDEASYRIKKQGVKPFILGHRHLSIVAKIISKEAFEVAITEGIGKKRMFGFGLIDKLERI